MKESEKKRLLVQFPQILAELLERERSRDSRKKICNAVGISQAMLSQYLHGRATPRVGVLVALAEHFGVDLHYLICGEQLRPRSIDLGPFEYIDKSLAGLHAKHDAYFSAVARITAALADEVEVAARKVVEQGKELSGGLLHDDEVFELEPYSHETVLVRMRLDYQFDGERGEPHRTMPGGRFLPLVARNLSEGRKYTYILPGGVRDWRPQVQEFRKALRHIGVSEDALRSFCRIGITGSLLVAGCVLYRLDMPLLRSQSPHLYHQVAVSTVADRRDHWLGCTLPPSTRLQANPVMDSYHLEQARKMVGKMLETDFEEV